MFHCVAKLMVGQTFLLSEFLSGLSELSGFSKLSGFCPNYPGFPRFSSNYPGNHRNYLGLSEKLSGENIRNSDNRKVWLTEMFDLETISRIQIWSGRCKFHWHSPISELCLTSVYRKNVMFLEIILNIYIISCFEFLSKQKWYQYILFIVFS